MKIVANKKYFEVRPMIIVFTGAKGSGKDTCAYSLRKYLALCQYTTVGDPIKSKSVNFADKLREVCSDLFGMTHSQMIDPAQKEVPLDHWPFQTPRYILQRFATEGTRSCWPDMWVHHWQQRASLELRLGSIVVVTDLRFPNERVAIEKLAMEEQVPFVIINVVRPSLGKSTDTHESEAYIGHLGHHVELLNGGNIQSLCAKTPKAVAKALKVYDADMKAQQNTPDK